MDELILGTRKGLLITDLDGVVKRKFHIGVPISYAATESTHRLLVGGCRSWALGAEVASLKRWRQHLGRSACAPISRWCGDHRGSTGNPELYLDL